MKRILLIICLLMCSGCSDYVEINDLVIVPGIIIDYVDDNFEVTSEIILNDTESTVKVITTKCPTIDSCLADISKMSNKSILMSHLKVLILTNNIISNNIDFYDYFLRDSKSKMNFKVYIIDSKIKDELFKVKTNKEGVSLHIEEISKYNKEILSSSIILPFIDLVYMNLEKGLEPIYPNIEVKDNNDNKNIYLENSVLYKDKKEVILDSNDTIMYNILNNKLKRSVIDMKCDNESFSITIDKVKTKKKWKNNTFNFNINLIADVNNYKCKYDLNDKDTINKLNKITENEIKNNLNKVINISKDNNYDYLGIGNYIYKYDTKYYKNNFKLEDVNTNVNLKVSINSVGEKRK